MWCHNLERTNTVNFIQFFILRRDYKTLRCYYEWHYIINNSSVVSVTTSHCAPRARLVWGVTIS